MIDRELAAAGAETQVPFARAIDLSLTCAPVAWGGGRWPNEAWSSNRFCWVGRDGGHFLRRAVRQEDEGVVVESSDGASSEAWIRRVFAPADLPASFGDPVVAAIAKRANGFAALCYGSLFDGAVVSIVGQSISVASAAVTATRLSALFHPGTEIAGRTMHPLPTWDELAGADAAFVRRSGVTGKRAECLVRLGRSFADGEIPDWPVGESQIGAAAAALLALPGIGPWTVASALLWGTGHADAFPRGDAALLRAARRAYGEASMDHLELTRRAETWRPWRATASRLLWLDLFGPAPTTG